MSYVDDRAEKVWQMRQDGKKFTEIGKALNISATTAGTDARRHNWRLERNLRTGPLDAASAFCILYGVGA